MNETLDPTIDEGRARLSTLIALYAATVFVSAFLLFQVQPMIGKYILPWFGSTPGVWTTALLFFQLMLLAGYAYVHFVVGRLTLRRQAMVHAALLGLALIALPITPAEALKPIGPEAPVGRILLILTLSVGAPFFLLSATAPLLQKWFAHLVPRRSPYRLYALSNLGSLLALLSYPFLVERFVRLQSQTVIWSLGYVVFAGLCVACAWHLYRLPVGAARELGGAGKEDAGVDAGPGSPDESGDRPRAGMVLSWLSLSAVGSGLLMATTNQMSLDIAVVPLLWVVPLTLYLLTFILCFDSDRWYVRPLFAALLPLSLINAVRLLYVGPGLGILDQIVGYSITLFVCCMACHGELARIRPPSRHLTFFFLMVALGGAMGGIFVAVLAPAIFPGPYEYHLLLVACYGLVVLVQTPQLFRPGQPKKKKLMRMLSAICWEVALLTIFIGAVRVLVPSTWYDADAAMVRAAAFASWREDLLMTVPYVSALFVLVFAAWRRTEGETLRAWWGSGRGATRFGVSALLAVGLWSLSGALVWQVREAETGVVLRGRNFYGMLVIEEQRIGTTTHGRSLTHGRIRHGLQVLTYPGWPTAYFGPETGVGVALRYHPARSDPTRQFRVGVVGLGVGTLAAYANARVDPDSPPESYVHRREGGVPDYTRFYEINPLVERWARASFTFLEDAASRGADVDVFQGDARIVLERQLEQGQGQRFDILALDAFSSDAIPIHLLTQESFQTYMGHLNEDGILAVHVTNRYVDLIPIVARLAEVVGMRAVYIRNDWSERGAVTATDWILLTKNLAFFDTKVVLKDKRAMPAPGPLWTDDFSSIFEVVRLND